MLPNMKRQKEGKEVFDGEGVKVFISKNCWKNKARNLLPDKPHFFRLRLRSCSKIFESGSESWSGNSSNLRIRLLFRLRLQSLIQPKFVMVAVRTYTVVACSSIDCCSCPETSCLSVERLSFIKTWVITALSSVLAASYSFMFLASFELAASAGRLSLWLFSCF